LFHKIDQYDQLNLFQISGISSIYQELIKNCIALSNVNVFSKLKRDIKDRKERYIIDTFCLQKQYFLWHVYSPFLYQLPNYSKDQIQTS
jgi:hypothetical protein